MEVRKANGTTTAQPTNSLETKILESASESLSQRINDVRTTIAALVAKIETDPYLNWPSFLGTGQFYIILDALGILEF